METGHPLAAACDESGRGYLYRMGVMKTFDCWELSQVCIVLARTDAFPCVAVDSFD